MKLIVTLKGEAKNTLSSIAGIYVLEPKLVNDKSYWLQDPNSNAIWYDKQYRGWNVGSQDDLGSSAALIISQEDVAGPQEATTWQIANGKQFIVSDDILVDTFVEPGTYIQIIHSMAIRVVEFSNGGYKIRKIFA